MSTQYFTYRDLRVYQHAKDYVIFVYALLKQFPKEEQYALCDQLRRASVSIPSNLVEGMSRASSKEQLHFIENNERLPLNQLDIHSLLKIEEECIKIV